MEKRIAELELRNLELTQTLDYVRNTINGLFTVSKSKTGYEIVNLDESWISTLDMLKNGNPWKQIVGTDNLRYSDLDIPYPIFNGASQYPDHINLIKGLTNSEQINIRWMKGDHYDHQKPIGYYDTSKIVLNSSCFVGEIRDYAKLRRHLQNACNVSVGKEAEYVDVLYQKNLEIQELRRTEDSKIGLAVTQHVIFQDQIRRLNEEISTCKVSIFSRDSKITTLEQQHAEEIKQIKANHANVAKQTESDHLSTIQRLETEHREEIAKQSTQFKQMYNQLVVGPAPADYAKSLTELSERNAYLETKIIKCETVVKQTDTVAIRNEITKAFEIQLAELQNQVANLTATLASTETTSTMWKTQCSALQSQLDAFRSSP